MNWKALRWQGYLRADGRIGIRNRVLVIYTVKCAEFVAQQIVRRSDNVDVELVGFDGCTDNQYAVNLLIALIRHPNVGAVLAVPFAVAAASNIVTNRVVVFLVRLFLSLVRTLPTLVCALIATYIFGLGTMAGTCAIAVFTFAYVGKQLFEIIETVDMGPYEAMEALGATRLQAFTTAVFPQVLPTYLSVSLFCLEGNVRYASILGYVGAGGLGLIMNEKIGWREYDSLGMILIVLFVTVIVIEALSHWLRKRLT